MHEPNLLLLAALIGINAWVAWAYSGLPVSQDEGLWMLWPFTGSRPYVDHVDCKPPGVHLWARLVGAITGRRVRAFKLVHGLTVGAFGPAAYWLSGDLLVGVAFSTIVHSAWLEAYYAWVETLSAGLLLVAFYLPPAPAALAALGAVCVNLKLVLPVLVLIAARRLWVPSAVLTTAGLAAACVLATLRPSLVRDLWYGVVTVPRRMVRARRARGQSFRGLLDRASMIPLLLVLPLVLSGTNRRAYPVSAAMAAAYVAFNSLGRVWRPNHWIPLAAMVAPLSPAAAVPMFLTDLLTNRLYLGNAIARHRPHVASLLESARRVGTTLAEDPGAAWVYGPFTQIYVYARKRPGLLPVEQVEIRDVIPERRDSVTATVDAVDAIVVCPGELDVSPDGFHTAALEDGFRLLLRDAAPS